MACPSCGLLNDPSARFCRNCGLPLGWAEDPVRGTTTRRADLPSERGSGVASIVGLIAAVAVLAVAAFFVLRPSNPGTGPLPTRTPTPSAFAVASPSILPGTSVVPSGSSPLPSPSAEGSPEPTDQTTEPPGSFPATVDFTCDPANIGDPTNGRWHVTHVDWAANATSDQIQVKLTRDGDTTRSGAMTVESMALDEVSGRIGMNPPPGADRAVVLTMSRRFTAFQLSTSDTGMAVIKNLAIGKGSDELWHFVLGVSGTGCHRAGVEAWDTDPAATDVLLLIDVEN